MQEPALMLLLTVVTEVPQLLANPTDCRENEYLDEHGQCQPCKECGPGLELSKECGYGEGSQAQCVPCHPRRFKAQWGHHGCKPCLWCALINRTQKSNCTATTDAACGECLPGFYSKTQIRGLQDLECVPCTKQTPSSELQCRSKMRLVKVESPPAPATDLPLGVLTSSALVILALVLLTVSVLYCQRFWKDHGQRVFVRSQNFPGQRVTFQPSALPSGFSCRETVLNLPCLHIQSLSPCHRPAQDYNEAVQYTPNAEVSGLPLPCHRPDVEFSNLITLGSTAPLAGNLTEAQPLIRDSGCSDCSAGGSSLAESRQDPAGDPGSPAPLSSCATERQHRWPHTPVECTELDLQTFSTQTEFVDTGRNGFAQRQLRGEEVVASAGPACSVFSTGQEKLPPASAQEPFLSFRNPAVESGEQLGEDVQSLVAKIGDVVQDLSIASLPDSLVLSLALQLDPSLPGLKNFIHLGMELGVPSHQLSQMSSFTDLVAYLSDSGRPLPTAILARALQTCQRFDALLLLYDHFTGSPIENVQS
nr:tumor necrosis factor receptor superfamily member 27 isoform X1 [Pogona vitticeps]XP_020640066.1 tumor necrosis factor receptor superfamily member 27 isoform X1 [Pogona vitticeps]XP_020640067.1 tumor necrosis factor receptor superfamily member 27 isoform X1 [Pogona vitticeps]XP_020640068.1 tumor necrosis factor receptor superfamily member 27 isoform X1 [Pogona vitticeps]